jgi:hypothetical protein
MAAYYGHVDALALVLLRRIHEAERLSAEALERLLAWQHSGFSVHVGEAIEPTARKSLERLGRYIARAPIASSKVKPQEDGRVTVHGFPAFWERADSGGAGVRSPRV